MAPSDPLIISVKVLLGGGQEEVLGYEGEFLKVRINAVPEKGKANEALIRLLAKHFDVSRSDVTIISGATSRKKRIAIAGVQNRPN